MKKILIPFLVIIHVFALNALGQDTLKTRNVISGLDTPWEILWGPDGWIWFTERKGIVGKVDPATGDSVLIKKISDVTEFGESGLMGMVLHPNFDDSPFVYVSYTYGSGTNLTVKVVRFTYQNGTLINPSTLIDNIKGNSIHDGCRLAISKDRKLFITTGDAGNTSLPQNTGSLNGKFLRLNLDGSIPADNPFPNSPVWSKGHRNPQGVVFANGFLYSSEHGPNNDDEFNIIKKGRNYGWPNVQGFCDPPEQQFCNDSNVVEPLVAWTPTLAVAGIDYYGLSRIDNFKNSILMTTLKDSKLVRLELNSAGDSVINEEDYFEDKFGRLRDVLVGPDGKVYIATSNRDGRGNPIASDDRIIEIDGTKIVCTCGVPEETFFLYPNPTNGLLYIQNTVDIFSVTISDLLGRVVFSENFSARNNKINIGDLSSGIYLISFEENGKKQKTKLLYKK